MRCQTCQSTGFKNIHQVDEETIARFEATGEHSVIEEWIKAHPDSDVAICDCCGDGSGWYGVPGEHYAGGDDAGRNGPYAYNGGLPECS